MCSAYLLFFFGFVLKVYLDSAHQGASNDTTLRFSNTVLLLFAVHCSTAYAAQARPSRALRMACA